MADPDNFSGEFYSTFKKEITQITQKIIPELKRR